MLPTQSLLNEHRKAKKAIGNVHSGDPVHGVYSAESFRNRKPKESGS